MSLRAGSTWPPLQVGMRWLRFVRHLPNFVRLYWRWFGTLGFGAVFSTTWQMKLVAFGVVACLSAVLLLASGLLATSARLPPVRRFRLMGGNGISIEGLPELLNFSPEDLPWRLIVVVVAGVLS